MASEISLFSNSYNSFLISVKFKPISVCFKFFSICSIVNIFILFLEFFIILLFFVPFLLIYLSIKFSPFLFEAIIVLGFLSLRELLEKVFAIIFFLDECLCKSFEVFSSELISFL